MCPSFPLAFQRTVTLHHRSLHTRNNAHNTTPPRNNHASTQLQEHTNRSSRSTHTHSTAPRAHTHTRNAAPGAHSHSSGSPNTQPAPGAHYNARGSRSTHTLLCPTGTHTRAPQLQEHTAHSSRSTHTADPTPSLTGTYHIRQRTHSTTINSARTATPASRAHTPAHRSSRSTQHTAPGVHTRTRQLHTPSLTPTTLNNNSEHDNQHRPGGHARRPRHTIGIPRPVPGNRTGPGHPQQPRTAGVHLWRRNQRPHRTTNRQAQPQQAWPDAHRPHHGPAPSAPPPSQSGPAPTASPHCWTPSPPIPPS